MFYETRYNINQLSQKYNLPFVLVSCGSIKHDGPVERPEGFFCHHLIWILEGKGEFRVDGQRYILNSGEGVFCRTGEPHSYKAIGDKFKTRFVTFIGIDGVLDYYNVGRYFKFKSTESIDNAAATLDAFCRGRSDGVSRSAAGYSFMTNFLRDCFSAGVSFGRKVDSLLESSFDRNLSLDSIAAELCMSKYTLCRRYSDEQGVTVIEQLKRIRIAKAKQYLTGTARPINEISEICGFESPSYFCKVFRKLTGYTPNAYRRRRTY